MEQPSAPAARFLCEGGRRVKLCCSPAMEKPKSWFATLLTLLRLAVIVWAVLASAQCALSFLLNGGQLAEGWWRLPFVLFGILTPATVVHGMSVWAVRGVPDGWPALSRLAWVNLLTGALVATPYAAIGWLIARDRDTVETALVAYLAMTLLVIVGTIATILVEQRRQRTKSEQP